jgi:DNA-binding NarL/FixJ family response regulator
MPKLRILMVDDHETVREGLKAILNTQSDMEVVAEAGDGEAALATAKSVDSDIIIMDVSMPRLNGLRATEAIKQLQPHAKILALTRHAETGYLQMLMRAGAAGYVLKQSRASEILKAIRTIASGATYVDPQLAAQLAPTPAVTAVDPPPRRARAGLTAREEEVLRLVALGYSNKEIATRLTLSVKTVETHKANAADKLGLASRIEIVRFAMLHGWLKES